VCKKKNRSHTQTHNKNNRAPVNKETGKCDEMLERCEQGAATGRCACRASATVNREQVGVKRCWRGVKKG